MKLKRFNFWLKGNLLPKSSIKACRIISGLVIICILTFYLVANVFLMKNEKRIVTKVKGYFSQPFTYKNLYYEFPNIVVIEDFRWSGKTRQDALLHVKEVKAHISWIDVLRKPGKSLRYLDFIDLEIRGQSTLFKITKEVHHILKKIKSSNRGFEFSAHRIKFPFIENSSGDPYLGNMKLVYKNGQMDITGNIDTVIPVKYSLRSVKSGDKFDLQFIEATSDTLHTKLWGSWHLHDVNLKGHIFVNQSRFGRHSVVDIDSKFTAYDNKLIMESFKFLLDGKPVSLFGEWGFDMPQVFALNVDYSPQEVMVNENQRLKQLFANISGVRHADYAVANGKIGWKINPVDILGTVVKEMVFNFEQLEANISNTDDIAFHLTKADLSMPNEEQTLKLSDVHWNLIRTEGQPQVIRYYLPFYNGVVNGFSTLDQSVKPAIFASSVNVYDVNLGDIGLFMYDFKRLQGRMQGAIDINYVEGWHVNGYASLNDGKLQDHSLLDWVSEYFDLSSVKALEFNRLSSVFEYKKNGWKFDNIRLRSDNIKLDGFFMLNEESLVDSELSVYFNRDLLFDSHRLRPLVKKINEEHDQLQFDFRLTGYLDRVNVRWAPSDLKTEIVNIIPGFIQRKIESGLDSSI